MFLTFLLPRGGGGFKFRVGKRRRNVHRFLSHLYHTGLSRNSSLSTDDSIQFSYNLIPRTSNVRMIAVRVRQIRGPQTYQRKNILWNIFEFFLKIITALGISSTALPGYISYFCLISHTKKRCRFSTNLLVLIWRVKLKIYNWICILEPIYLTLFYLGYVGATSVYSLDWFLTYRMGL